MSAPAYSSHAPVELLADPGSLSTLRRTALVALLAVALGFVMQGLILGGKLAAGASFPGLQLYVDLAHGISWSLLVCTGVGIATSVARVRAAIGGLIAMLCAPIAIAVAKSSQKIMASLVGAAGQPALLSIGAISVLKAVEYGVLGWLLARLVQRDSQNLTSYIGAGAAVGLLFGGGITVLSYQVAVAKGGTPLPPQMLGIAINEMLFPIGCAFVIFIGQMIGRSMAATGGR